MYGAELRWLAIFKLVTLCLSAKVVMEHLCISRSSLKRWAARYAETGNVHKRSTRAGRKRKMSTAEELRLVERVLDSPMTTLSKERAQIILDSGIVVSLATLCRVLHKYGLTRQRVRSSSATLSMEHADVTVCAVRAPRFHARRFSTSRSRETQSRRSTFGSSSCHSTLQRRCSLRMRQQRINERCAAPLDGGFAGRLRW